MQSPAGIEPEHNVLGKGILISQHGPTIAVHKSFGAPSWKCLLPLLDTLVIVHQLCHWYCPWEKLQLLVALPEYVQLY